MELCAIALRVDLGEGIGTTPELYPESPAGTLRDLMAPRTGLLQPTSTKAQINPGLSLWLDEKRGSRHHLDALLDQ